MMAGEPDLDEDRLAEAALALMSLTQHDDDRVWKQYPWSLTDRLFDLGYITDPKRKARSVRLTPEGKARAESVLRERSERGVRDHPDWPGLRERLARRYCNPLSHRDIRSQSDDSRREDVLGA